MKLSQFFKYIFLLGNWGNKKKIENKLDFMFTIDLMYLHPFSACDQFAIIVFCLLFVFPLRKSINQSHKFMNELLIYWFEQYNAYDNFC